MNVLSLERQKKWPFFGHRWFWLSWVLAPFRGVEKQPQNCLSCSFVDFIFFSVCLFSSVCLRNFIFRMGRLQINSTRTRSFGKLEARSIPAKSCSAEIKIKMEIWFRFNVGLSKPRRSSKRGAATFSRWTKFRRTDFFAYCGSAKLVLPRTAQPGSSCFNKNQSVAPSLGTC